MVSSVGVAAWCNVRRQSTDAAAAAFVVVVVVAVVASCDSNERTILEGDTKDRDE